MTSTGGPAFPFHIAENVAETGMTMRDYFAAKMMPSQLAQEACPYLAYNYENAAINAYKMADAMLKVREGAV